MLSGHFFGSQVTIMTNSEALSLYGLTALYFSFSLMTLGSMALFFSTVFNRMSSAAITVVTIYFVSFVTSSLPFASALRPWLISEIMNNANAQPKGLKLVSDPAGLAILKQEDEERKTLIKQYEKMGYSSEVARIMATKAPQMLVQRVEPSACITSASIVIVLVPSFSKSTQALKLLPINL